MDDQKPKPEGEKQPEKPSFWKTFPGILTGIAAIVTAVATLLAAADKAGLFSASPAPPSQADNTPPDPSDSGASTSGDNSPIVQDTDGNVTITVGE